MGSHNPFSILVPEVTFFKLVPEPIWHVCSIIHVHSNYRHHVSLYVWSAFSRVQFCREKKKTNSMTFWDDCSIHVEKCSIVANIQHEQGIFLTTKLPKGRMICNILNIFSYASFKICPNLCHDTFVICSIILSPSCRHVCSGQVQP